MASATVVCYAGPQHHSGSEAVPDKSPTDKPDMTTEQIITSLSDTVKRLRTELDKAVGRIEQIEAWLDKAPRPRSHP